jgi:hypothetical protein
MGAVKIKTKNEAFFLKERSIVYYRQEPPLFSLDSPFKVGMEIKRLKIRSISCEKYLISHQSRTAKIPTRKLSLRPADDWANESSSYRPIGSRENENQSEASSRE